MTDWIIETHGLTKHYAAKTAVDQLSLQVGRGQIFGLVGQNGAGKTTLIRMLTGQTLPDSGEIRLFGQTGKALFPMRHKIGAIVETPAFFPFLSAEENLNYYRLQRGIPGKERVGEVLRQVGLEDTGTLKFKNFSLGMKQRLGLGLALLGRPELLLLDEPVNGLDPLGIVQFRDILTSLSRERQMTILISSHILSELSAMATHYGFMQNGTLREQISAEALQEKCRNSLDIRVGDAAKAAVLLEQQLGCRAYEVLPQNVLRLYSHLDETDSVTRILVDGGVSVFGIAPHSFDLEAYFVSLVGSEETKGGRRHA